MRVIRSPSPVLTIARVPLILIFFAGALWNASHPTVWLFVVSCIALAASAITDLFDGFLARRYKVETTFGAHADPLMDKFFYLATLPLLVYVAVLHDHIAHGAALLVMTLVFLARDLWVTFLRAIGSIYNVSGKAHWAGKLRTAINFPLFGAIYVFEESPISLIPAALIYSAEACAFIINAVSLYTYTRIYWPSLRKAAAIPPRQES